MTEIAVLALAVALVVKMVRAVPFGFDFKGDRYDAGHAMVHGLNPYQSLDTQ